MPDKIWNKQKLKTWRPVSGGGGGETGGEECVQGALIYFVWTVGGNPNEEAGNVG